MAIINIIIIMYQMTVCDVRGIGHYHEPREKCHLTLQLLKALDSYIAISYSLLSCNFTLLWGLFQLQQTKAKKISFKITCAILNDKQKVVLITCFCYLQVARKSLIVALGICFCWF